MSPKVYQLSIGHPLPSDFAFFLSLEAVFRILEPSDSSFSTSISCYDQALPIGTCLRENTCAWRLHPKRTKKARKGNVGTSVEWRLNSENDSRLHGQPSIHLEIIRISYVIWIIVEILGTARESISSPSSGPRKRNELREYVQGSASWGLTYDVPRRKGKKR